MAAKPRVISIGHGFEPSDEALKAEGIPRDRTLEAALAWQKALDMGIKMVARGNIGAVPHGDNARELELMIEAGVPLLDVLQAATLHVWEPCGGDLCGRRFGC
ncbi:hypothetical protein EG327_007141 [Venturia inaequalis]|uniref:Uncharacterized protein n=1 Tax=Venturia inaequalis TaxID=5025 RepID=A0A8H3V0X8_VENIN|nr:hypothetical protein EG327_007141 [Venturia inaequalis]